MLDVGCWMFYPASRNQFLVKRRELPPKRALLGPKGFLQALGPSVSPSIPKALKLPLYGSRCRCMAAQALSPSARRFDNTHTLTILTCTSHQAHKKSPVV